MIIDLNYGERKEPTKINLTMMAISYDIPPSFGTTSHLQEAGADAFDHLATLATRMYLDINKMLVRISYHYIQTPTHLQLQYVPSFV